MNRLGVSVVRFLTVLCVALAASCNTSTTPQPTQQASTPSQPAAAPTAQPAPAASATPPVAPSPGTAPLVSEDTNITGVVAEATECARKDGVLSIKVRLRNTSSAGKHVGILSNRNYESYYLSAANKKYFILKDSAGTYLTPSTDGFGQLGVDIDAAGQYTWWAKFPAPPAEVKMVTLYTPIAAPLEDIPVTDK